MKPGFLEQELISVLAQGAGSVQDSKTLWVTELAKVGQPEHIISRRTDRLDGIATVHSH